MLQSTKSMKSMRKTRRSSRQVVLDELELVMRRLEQIKNMVDKHCVAPSKEKEPSVRSQIVAHMQSKAEAKPLTPVQEEEAAVEEAAVEEAPLKRLSLKRLPLKRLPLKRLPLRSLLSLL